MPAQRFSHQGLKTGQLLGQGHRICAWTGRFRADVQNISAITQQFLGMLQRLRGLRMRTTIGKRVWRDIDNPHHQRLGQIQVKARGSPMRDRGWWQGSEWHERFP